MENNRISTRIVAEAGVLLALSVVLGRIVLFRMPQGGSVTAGSMVPLVLFSIKWGWRKGILVCTLAGVLEMLLGGYVIHPLQGLLDYPLAFGAMGLAGWIKGPSTELKNRAIPILSAFVLRIVFHILSAVIYFSSNLLPTVNPVVNGIIYNGSFLGVELVITFVILGLLWKPLQGFLVATE